MEMMSAVRPLETFVPPRAAGQRDVLSLALPPMPLLHVAFVGVGARAVSYTHLTLPTTF